MLFDKHFCVFRNLWSFTRITISYSSCRMNRPTSDTLMEKFGTKQWVAEIMLTYQMNMLFLSHVIFLTLRNIRVPKYIMYMVIHLNVFYASLALLLLTLTHHTFVFVHSWEIVFLVLREVTIGSWTSGVGKMKIYCYTAAPLVVNLLNGTGLS